MIQIQKNKVLAEYLNIDFDKLYFSQKMDFGEDWNNLMNVAIKLKEETQYASISFNQNHLSFDKETLFENCFETIKYLEKYKKAKN